MRNTNIETADHTWNPVTGCCHGCTYCYAEKIANRFSAHDDFVNYLKTQVHNPNFVIKQGKYNDTPINLLELETPFKDFYGKAQPYPVGWHPTFHKYRLDFPTKVKEPSSIFVCSMADLFGNWVPDEWIYKVFESCITNPQHDYVFLTKNPSRYTKLNLPNQKNMWYGSTVSHDDVLVYRSDKLNTFFSIEPILEPLDNTYHGIDWVIIGAETGRQKDKVIPEKKWIMDIVDEISGTIPIYMKKSLTNIVGENNMLRQFPEGFKIGDK